MMARAWLIFFIGSLHLVLSQLYRTANAVLTPWLIQDLSLDTEGLGMMSAAFFYAFALTQVPLSLFLDRIGPRRMMTSLALVGVAGGLLFSWSQGLASAVLGRTLLGVGLACSFVGTLKLLTEWFPPLIFATLSGMVYAVGTLGNMVSTTPLVLMVEQWGWRLSFQMIAGVHLALTVALFLIVRDHPPGRPAPAGPPEGHGDFFASSRRLLGSRDYWIISAGTFVRYGTHAALQALWAGPLLMEVMGFAPVQAGNIILLMNIGMIIGGPLWGALSDRVFQTRRGIVGAGLLLMALIMAGMRSLPPGTGFFMVGAAFFLFGLASASGLLVYPHIKGLVPPDMAGAALTGVNFFTMMGPAVFLQGLGTMMQGLFPTASRGPDAFKAALLICIGFQVAIGLLYFFTRDLRPQKTPSPAQEGFE
jgi:sugar phosphate permease